eukprot:scaffold4200_cov361-Prasinococcus_capsulatus_cf.AAC.3
MDPVADHDLLWIARDGLRAPLPQEWKPWYEPPILDRASKSPSGPPARGNSPTVLTNATALRTNDVVCSQSPEGQ